MDIAVRLSKESGWEPCYWISDPFMKDLVKEKFPGIIFHSNFDAVRGIRSADCSHLKISALDQSILKEYAYGELITLQMMNRMDSIDCFSYGERVRLYHTLLRYWSAVLEQFKPDAVLFVESPHLIYDYILFMLCKKKGIKTIMFDRTSLEGLIFSMESFEDGSKAIKSLYEQVLTEKKVGSPLKVTLSESSEKYLKRISGEYSKDLPFYHFSHRFRPELKGLVKRKLLEVIRNPRLVLVWAKVPNIYEKRMGKKIEEPSIMTRWEFIRCRYRGRRKKKRLLRYYEHLVQDVDYTRPYIYVPMHYQPERSTSPMGEVFANQFLMIDLLSKTVPEGWQIYIKESPRQFSTLRSNGERARTKDFYDDVVLLPNVRFISLSCTSFDLIDHSKAVATVTGTSGWEALCRGKPALIFGHPWYRYCEGVFYTPTKEACRDAVSKIADGYTVDKESVRLFVSVVERVCARGFFNPLPMFAQASGVSYEDNVVSLTKAIQTFVRETWPGSTLKK
ncbi:MAG: hypothetical protein V1726_03705 [Methanobacteriota archaeon]